MWEIKFKKRWDIKKIKDQLKTIKGVNEAMSKRILRECGVSEDSLMAEMRQRHLEVVYNKLTEWRKEGKIDDKLKETEKRNIEKSIKLNTIKGIRHKRKIPQKGRTRSNSNTRKRWSMN